MINRIYTGRGALGAIKYVLHDKHADTTERADVLNSTFCSDDLLSMSRELRELYQARRAICKDIVGNPVRHIVLSASPGERLTDDQWLKFSTAWMKAMGYKGQPQLVVRHTDTEQDHLHIVTLRIRPDGSLVSDKNEKLRAHKATQRLVKRMGLKPLPPREKQLSKPDGFDIQRVITAEKLAEMRKAKQYPLAKLSKATGADFSCLGPELIFCMTKAGRTLAKLRDNTQIVFQDGKVSIKAPSAERRHELQRLIGSVIFTKGELGQHDKQQAFIDRKRQQLRAKKSGLAGEQRQQVSRGVSPTPQEVLEQRNIANAWALSATAEQRQAHREAVSAFESFQAISANAHATGSSQAPALAVAVSNVRSTTSQIDALNLLIAQTTDPVERGRLIGQIVALEQQRAAQLRDEMDAINEAWQREEQRKTDEAKASLRRKPRF